MTSLIRRIAGERRSTLSNPSYGLLEALSSFGPTYTGKPVTPRTSLSLVAVYSCINLLSTTVGSLPLQLCDRTVSRATRVVAGPTADLLSREANPELPAGELWELAMVHLLTHGNAFIYKERDSFGRVSALWPILPGRVKVGRDPVSKQKVFSVQNPQAGGVAAGSTRDILHIRGMGVDGLVGLSPIECARQALAIYAAHEEYQGRYYRNNAAPGGFIGLPPGKKLDADGVKQLKANWDSAHRGLDAAGKIGVLMDGQEFTPIPVSLADQQFIDQQHFSISQVCNLFRVPQWMLGEASGDSLTYANVEQTGDFYATYSVSPWCVRFERSLLADGDILTKPELYTRFLLDELFRADLKSRFEAHAIAVDKGIKSRSEIREQEDLDPTTDVPDFGPLVDPNKASTPATR